MIKRVSIFIVVLLSAFSFQLSAAYAESNIAVVEKPFMEGRYERAVYEAQRLIDERSAQRYEVYYLKGSSELKLGKFKEARQSFEAIISKYPNSNRVFDAYVGIGDSYLLEGDKEDAARKYNEIKEKFPSDKNIALVDSRLSSASSPAIEPASKSTPVAVAPAASVVEAPKGHLSVQAGCFKSERNADALSAKLIAHGYQSYVELPLAAGDKLYRVKVGRLQSKGEAESLAARLNRDGYKTKICDDSSQ